MFKQRLLTVLLLVPLVLLAIYYANPVWLWSAVVILVVLGGWEWAQLIPLRSLINKIIFVCSVLVLTDVSGHILPRLLSIGLGLWALMIPLVLGFPRSQKIWGYRWIVMGFGVLLLPLCAGTLAAIYQHVAGQHLIVYLLCLVWATDIGAYLFGKYWGRHKLIPQVSPGKTWEGALGGFLLALLVVVLGGVFFHPSSRGLWYGVGVMTIVISMLGDLFISMLKRRVQIKDTGRIFPGHGGVLDRIDSLMAACPVFYYGLLLMG